jgi:hypothetical protein
LCLYWKSISKVLQCLAGRCISWDTYPLNHYKLQKIAIPIGTLLFWDNDTGFFTIFEFIKLSTRPWSIIERKNIVELSHPASTKAVTTWTISAHSYCWLRQVILAGNYYNAQSSLVKMLDWRSIKNKRFTVSPMSLTFQWKNKLIKCMQPPLSNPTWKGDPDWMLGSR